jgi:hypothetical protein
MSAYGTDVDIRPNGWYPVLIVYRRPMDLVEDIMQALGGGHTHCEFLHCELYVPDAGGTFTIFKGGTMVKETKLPILYKCRPDKFAWHIIPLNRGEFMRMLQWNTEQIAHHCPYNFRDLAWQIVPENVRNSYVKDLSAAQAHNPKSMFCSQAILLALREASNEECARPILRNFAYRIKSRLATPTDLARLTTEYLGVGVNCSRVPTTIDEVNDCLHEAVHNKASYFSMYNTARFLPVYN